MPIGVGAVETMSPLCRTDVWGGSWPGGAQKVKRRATAAAEEPPNNTKRYTAGDFEFLRDRLNADLEGSSRVRAADARLTPDDEKLRVVDMLVTSECLCVPLICPALLHSGLSKLAKPFNMKLSGEGTYRLMVADLVFITYGVNVKHWSRSMEQKNDNLYSFRSKFIPLEYAIANHESEGAYAHLANVMLAAGRSLGHDLSAGSILQWHGDMHKSLEAARLQVAPQSTRLSDLAHVLGETSQSSAGVPGLVEKKLGHGADPSMLSFILQYPLKKLGTG